METHRVEEITKRAFVKLINFLLHGDPLMANDELPLHPESLALYETVSSGVLLCALINKVVPDTININSIYQKPKSNIEALANHDLALKSAQKIGCNVNEINIAYLFDVQKPVVLEFIWQIIRRGLVELVTVEDTPQLSSLREDDEDVASFLELTPEELLLRWCRSHVLTHFPSATLNTYRDLHDGKYFLVLLHCLEDSLNALQKIQIPDTKKRLEEALFLTELIVGAPVFFDAELLEADERFRFAFLTILFQARPPVGDGKQRRNHQRSKIAKSVAIRIGHIQSSMVRPSSWTSSSPKASGSSPFSSAPKKQLLTAERELFDLERKRGECFDRDREVTRHQKQFRSRSILEQQRKPITGDGEDASIRELQHLSLVQQQVQADSLSYLLQQETILTARIELVHVHILRLTSQTDSLRNLPEIQAHLKELFQEKFLLEAQLRRLRDDIESLRSKQVASPVVSTRKPLANRHRPGFRRIFVTVKQARNLVIRDAVNKSSDPFVVVRHLDDKFQVKARHRTRVVPNNHINPVWDETMDYKNFEETDCLDLTIWDMGSLGFDFMGNVALFRDDLQHGSSNWCPLKIVDSSSPRHYKPEVLLNKYQNFARHIIDPYRTAVKDKFLGKIENITGELLLEIETIE